MTTPPAFHPADDTLVAYGRGTVDGATAAIVAEHLEICDACRRRAAGLSADGFVGRLQATSVRAEVPDPGRSLYGVTRSTRPVPPPDVPPELTGCEQYEHIRELGRGGMGVVYLAKNRLMGRDEVLKVVNRSMLDRPGAVERFLQEIQSAAKLQHPNVVAAYSALQLGDLLVFAMEYVPGQDLTHVVTMAGGPLPVAHACYYAYQTARGLQHAHEKAMVHRDIKPSNLILTRDGKKLAVKILDFGLAKVTSEKGFDAGLTGGGKMLGTPAYMAPEQAMDAAKADIRADVYSLGCTLYYLLTGRAPFAADNLIELLQHHQVTEAPAVNLVRPDVPVELARVVARMMAKAPGTRYQTPGEVAKALAPFVKPGAGLGSAPDVSPDAAETAEATETVSPGPSTVPPRERPGVPGAAGSDGETRESDSATERSRPVAFVRTPHRPNARRPWLRPAVAAGLVLAALFAPWAGGVFKVKTKEGTIELTDLPPDSEVLVDGEKVMVTWADGSAAVIGVKAGSQHQIEVRVNGVAVQGETLTVAAGERKSFTVRLTKSETVKTVKAPPELPPPPIVPGVKKQPGEVRPTKSDFGKDNFEGWTTSSAGGEAGVTGPIVTENYLGQYWLSATHARGKPPWYWVAPAKYHGDHGDKFGRLLRFGMFTENPVDPADAPPGPFIILRGGKDTIFIAGRDLEPLLNKWRWSFYDVKLDTSRPWKRRTPDGAVPATAEDIRRVLANVEGLLIRGQFSTKTDKGTLDEVRFGEASK